MGSGQERIVLHVGCGRPRPDALHPTFREPGWREVRVDIDPAVEPDLVASITDLAPIAPESVAAIWSSHNLEHLFEHEVPVALAEFLRVLQPGGFALIATPDLQSVAELVAADRLEETAYVSAAGPITPLDMLFGFRPALAAGNHFMAHRTGFTARSLGGHLMRAGFAKVEVGRVAFELTALAQKSPVGRE